MELFRLLGKIAIDNSESTKVLDDVSEKAQGIREKLERIGDSLISFGDKMSKAGSKLSLAVTAPLTVLGKLSVSTAASFEDVMLKVQSLTGATQEEYRKLVEAAKQYGSTTAWTAKDVGNAMEYMALAGFDTNEILAATSGMLSLASASGEDLATVTDILTDSMTAFGDGASDASRYADVLATVQAKSNTTVGQLGAAFKYVAPLAGSYGYKLEDVATALGMMANAGVKDSMSGTGLANVITRLGTNTDGCREAIEKMGVSFYNQDGTARNLSLVLKDLCDKTQSLSVEERAALAKQIAGMEAQKGLLAILNQGSAAYTDLENKIKSCNGAASEMATNMESGLGGSLRSLKSALEGVTITIGEKLAPYVTKAADKIKDFTTWFQNLDEKTQDLIVRIGLFVAAVGPVLTVGGKIISGAGHIAKNVGIIIDIAKGLSPIIGTVVSGGGKVVTGIGSLVAKLGGGLLPALAAVPAPVWIIIAVIGALVAAGVVLYKHWDEVKEFASKVWGAIKDTVGSAVEKVKGFFSGIVDFFKNNWQGILLLLVNPIAGGFKLLYDNCSSFREFIDGFLENIKTGITNFFSGIGEKAHELKENISNKFHEMKDNVSAKIEEIKENASAKFTEIKENISSRVEEIKENASARFSEMKENISSKVEEIKENASAKFAELKENISSRVEEMKENAIAKINDMREKVAAGFQNMKETAAEKFNDLKERWTSKFEETREKMVSEATEMKEKVGERLEEFKTGAIEKIEAFKSNAVQKFTDMRDNVTSKISDVIQKGVSGFNEMKEKGGSAISSLRETAVSRFTEMAENVGSKFSAIADKVTSIFSGARDKLSQIVETVKGFFKFEWKLPEIKLPHFSIDGEFSLNPPSIPHLGVEWYAKAMDDPMIMERPTAFGINPAGQLMAGGEAGSEVVSGTNTLMRMISSAVAASNGQTEHILMKLYDLLLEYLPALAKKQVCLDTGALVGELAEPLNNELGWIAHSRERRN